MGPSSADNKKKPEAQRLPATGWGQDPLAAVHGTLDQDATRRCGSGLLSLAGGNCRLLAHGRYLRYENVFFNAPFGCQRDSSGWPGCIEGVVAPPPEFEWSRLLGWSLVVITTFFRLQITFGRSGIYQGGMKCWPWEAWEENQALGEEHWGSFYGLFFSAVTFAALFGAGNPWLEVPSV